MFGFEHLNSTSYFKCLILITPKRGKIIYIEKIGYEWYLGKTKLVCNKINLITSVISVLIFMKSYLTNRTELPVGYCRKNHNDACDSEQLTFQNMFLEMQ